jgi:dTDP-4-amino-4,6-dideoxygalactose transaminase
MQLMKIPILDLKAQYATIRQEIVPAILEVLESQNLCNGPAVRQFETQLAVYCQCSSALGLSSGTDALLLALMALDIGPGDEVITTPFTFFATAGVIWRVGARPVFVDIEPETFNIDATKIEAAITPKTKAIMPVHLYGQMADMDAIMAIARKHNLPVIEDAAQAVGSEYKGRRAGSIGTAGCFSFYVTKNLGAMGDAGAVTTNDPQLAIKMEKMRIHGMSDQYYHKWVGGNFRMDSIQAVSLSVKMRHLEGWTEKRRSNAQKYNQLLADCPGVTTPIEKPGRRHIYHQYILRVPRRDELSAYLKQQGVTTGVYYPLGLHMQECFASLGYQAGAFPHTEQACREVLALPVYPELADQQIEFVAAEIKKFVSR